MIRLTENSKKRFEIEEKISLQLKQNTKKSNLKNKLDSFFVNNSESNNISKIELQLKEIESEYNELISKKNPDKDKINDLETKIELKKSELKELSNLSNWHVKTQNIKYAAKTIRFGLLYKIDKLWSKILLVILFGSIASVSVWLLVQYTGVYTPGISGIIQGLAKIIRIEINNTGNEQLANIIYNILFWGLYVLINIPLIVFSYYKINKNFAILTLVYIISSQIVGFALGFINNGNGVFIFTNMNNPDALIGIEGYITGVQMLPWNANQGLVFGLFMYSLISSAINGIIYSAIYILGSSTGGTDIIGFYYSKIKNKSIAKLLTIFNIGSLMIGVILGSFICWIMQYTRINNSLPSFSLAIEAFFSPNLISSIIGAIVSGLLYNYYFPKNKIVKVQIYSNKINEIAISLKASEWNYKLSINSSESSVLSNDAENSKTLETICFYIDIRMLISIMRSVDSRGLITIYSTFGFDGELPTSSYEK